MEQSNTRKKIAPTYTAVQGRYSALHVWYDAHCSRNGTAYLVVVVVVVLLLLLTLTLFHRMCMSCLSYLWGHAIALPTAVLTAYLVPGTWQRSISVAWLCDRRTCISSRIEESARTLGCAGCRRVERKDGSMWRTHTRTQYNAVRGRRTGSNNSGATGSQHPRQQPAAVSSHELASCGNRGGGETLRCSLGGYPRPCNVYLVVQFAHWLFSFRVLVYTSALFVACILFNVLGRHCRVLLPAEFCFF